MATEEVVINDAQRNISFSTQVLEQVQPEVTLKSLCNLWYTKLTSTTGHKKLDITDSARCVVGEAYGFSEAKIYNPEQEFVYGCKPCAEIAAEFVDLLTFPKEGSNRDLAFDKQMEDNGFVTDEVLNNNKLVRKFVSHWSKDHV